MGTFFISSIPGCDQQNLMRNPISEVPGPEPEELGQKFCGALEQQETAMYDREESKSSSSTPEPEKEK